MGTGRQSPISDALRMLGRWAQTRTFRLLVGGLLLAILCAKVFQQRPHNSFPVTIRPTFLALGIVSTFGIVALRAWRWNLILGAVGRAMTCRELLLNYGSSLFLGLVSPARLGELSRIWFARTHARSLPAAASSVVFDRIFDIIPTLLVCVAVVMTFGVLGSKVVADAVLVAFGVTAAVALLALLWPSFIQGRVESMTRRLLTRLSSVEAGHSREDALVDPLSRSTMLVAGGLTLLSQLAVFMQTWFITKGLAVDLDPLAAYAIVTAAAAVAAIPISLGGIGSRELTISYLLVSLGLTQVQAFSFSLLCLVNFLVLLAVSFVVFAIQPTGS